MQITVIQNNPYYTNFMSKNKIIKSAALISSTIVSGELTFADNYNYLFNKSVDDDIKIEEYLINAVKTQERISKPKIADELGINIDVCKRKIRKGNPLYDLWLQTNHVVISSNEENDALIENKKRLEQINTNLWQIITDAYENKTPLTYSQLGRRLGITTSNCISRIKNNKTLVDMWNQIEHPRVTKESEDINKKIAEILTEANKKGRIISYKTIAEKVGITKDGVEQRIHSNPQLKALVTQTRYSRLSEESQDINERIEEFLKQSIKDNILIKIADIANKLELPFLNVRERLKRYPALADLWAMVPHHKGNVTNKSDENTEIDLKIKERLNYYIESETPVLMSELASDTEISYGKLKRRLEANRELSSLWKNTPRKNVGGLREYTQGENENLIKIMENYIAKGIRVDGIQLSKETGMTLTKFRAKLKHYPELKSVWQRLKNLDKNASSDVNKKIENILRNTIKNKIPLSARELERNVGTSRSACFQRIYQNEVLNELWAQIKANEHEQVTEKQNKIKEVLKKAITKNKKIRIYDITEETKVPYALCFHYLSKVPELQTLWQQIDHSLVREETLELSNEIKNILSEANQRGEKLYLKDIAEFTQTDYINVRDKIRRSEDLLQLWEENKKINYTLLKQIHELKLKNMTDDNIQFELELEASVFENLINEYNQLSKILEIHQDKNISDGEYLSWAVLSKREYELITNKIFEEMGYNAKATRYNSDGGVDVIMEMGKHNKKTVIIECIHNLTKKEKASEVLALEGVRAANNINQAILVASSGVHSNAVDCINKINENNPDSFKILTLEDMIKLSKKYGIDINSVDFNEFEENNETMLNYDTSTWFFKKSDKISDKEREQWQKMHQKEYERKLVELFIKKGYNVRSISREVGINGFYELEKDGIKTIVYSRRKSSTPKIDDIRGLYGCLNVFGADKVILIGVSGISAGEKSFIDNINKQKNKKGTFGIISFDKIVELLIKE